MFASPIFCVDSRLPFSRVLFFARVLGQEFLLGLFFARFFRKFFRILGSKHLVYMETDEDAEENFWRGLIFAWIFGSEFPLGLLFAWIFAGN